MIRIECSPILTSMMKITQCQPHIILLTQRQMTQPGDDLRTKKSKQNDAEMRTGVNRDVAEATKYSVVNKTLLSTTGGGGGGRGGYFLLPRGGGGPTSGGMSARLPPRSTSHEVKGTVSAPLVSARQQPKSEMTSCGCCRPAVTSTSRLSVFRSLAATQ